eukprot:TRINITY_DN6477_c0_g1_i3.p1 TRINITY_DN6477_c0_g1~~TRINITY_DN6477_c0_g1_i3.p1  ORF type:complete len:826 (-),score=144.28 TRINITY_DN6477_c0_g1_i3:48-2417(-)
MAAEHLSVQIIGARNLIEKSLFGKACPFVTIRFQGQSAVSRVIKNTNSPEWHETFTFKILDDARGDIVVCVWDKEVFRNIFLGTVVLRYEDVSKTGAPLENWFVLEKRSIKSRVRGDIRMRVMAGPDQAAACPYGDQDLADFCVLDQDGAGNVYDATGTVSTSTSPSARSDPSDAIYTVHIYQDRMDSDLPSIEQSSSVTLIASCPEPSVPITPLHAPHTLPATFPLDAPLTLDHRSHHHHHADSVDEDENAHIHDEDQDDVFREYLRKISTCRLCMTFFDGGASETSIISLECDHCICRDCLARHITLYMKGSMSSRAPPCPCGPDTCTRLPPWVLKELLPPVEHDAFLARSVQDLVESSQDFFRCPNTACGMIVERVTATPGLRQSLMPEGMTGVDGRPMSPEAVLHRETYRFRCRGCSLEFCSSCKTSPYHAGFDCAAFTVYNASKKCRFCTAKLTLPLPASSSSGEHSNPALAEVCTAEECVSKKALICKKPPKSCGHFCMGASGESKCLPCLDPVCVAKPADQTKGVTAVNLTQTSEDYCNICWVDSLGSAPCLQLNCGHVFHASCVHTKLAKKWPTPRITFGFAECPLCKTQISHPSLIQEVAAISKLHEEVQTKALQRLEYEGLARDKAILDPSSKYYKKPTAYAVERFAYFMCSRCSHPYFAGQRRCDAGDDAEKAFSPEDLVCGGCSGADMAQECPKHGKDFMEFKCQFCCTVASWYCWGKTHFCNDCHTKQQKGDYLTKKPKSVFPVCAGADVCALRVKHPHCEEFMLGCAVCRNLASF